MSTIHGHKHTPSVTQNHKAQLANAYNELGKELSSSKIRVVGNYTLGKVIGEGAYGKVRMGTHRLTSTRVAIKQIPKAMSASLTREIHHHRQLHHPNVTQMYEVIATESSIWIVTELCCGGELFDYLVEKGRLAEDETKVLFGQLCLAVAYLHENGIVHRDLKLENVLLDERCRVKLGDFGFTREFDRGSFMETFCGTTGYASPEMLQGKKYQGPEVDVWSLGIILYCLLTGTLPFDDDNEDVMRAKIIQGDFEDPTWLSLESRDLIKGILQMDVTKRLMIPQILAHPWFTTRKLTYEPDDEEEPLSSISIRPESPAERSQSTGPESHHSSEASTQGESIFTNKHDMVSSTPTTPDESQDPFEYPPPISSLHRNPSELTIRKMTLPDGEYHNAKMGRPETVLEEEQDGMTVPAISSSRAPSPLRSANSTNSKAPPVHPVRTPARTKRRSVSSVLSDPASPSADKTPTSLPIPDGRDLDFASLLSAPSPVIFSTPAERQLLNSLSLLGFDTAQIVHSVLTDACDAAGAVWWMLRKKGERKMNGEAEEEVASPLPIEGEKVKEKVTEKEKETGSEKGEGEKHHKKKKTKLSVGVQVDPASGHLNLARSAPQLAFVPPTPTFARPVTPPRPISPSRTPMLSPSTSSVADMSSRSHPSTPGGSLRDKDKDKDSAKSRKARSGSVSIMQRATTALEAAAAGLVRKRSSEAVREEKEREKERDRERERDKERSKDMERKIASGEESRSSHGSGSSRLTKSPPLKATKDKEYIPPSTPPPGDAYHSTPQIAGSPWVLADSRDSLQRPSGSALPEMVHSHSAPNVTSDNTPTGKAPAGPHRNRANLLTAFRLWFNEDRKGKRKVSSPAAPTGAAAAHLSYSRPVGSQQYGTKRRGSGSGNKYGPRSGHRAQRPSLSSRRSSSVNSRRSSGTSVQMVMLDSPQVPTRRSFGSHTPNSERGEYISSRPSSIRSFSMQPRHRKSPSASSSGSATYFRTASPMQSKYHRRGGSGSSTRVVRQVQPGVSKPPHVRSNSVASSIHSPPSSRPTSFYEHSESEGPRTTSPYRSRSRRSTDDTPRRPGSASSGTTFVAQKRQAPFMSPISHSMSRSSWKKSWGMEPPGWQSRTAHLPVEVLAISPVVEPTSLRDVFSGRQSLSMGDESDWVDEDDEIPAFAGGLGQMGSSASSAAAGSGTIAAMKSMHIEPPLMLSPAPRGHRSSSSGGKRSSRSGSSSNTNSTGSGRAKAGHSPAERVSPLPGDNSYESSDGRAGRRSLPAGRGPAFKHPIQEEDEGEEE
ncbi:hypothetical protein BDQ12DRAFT_705992 [Crucibulum laeve]|uniref:Protein kinase domain-containing protein n=1 Tax=Crucibulum laeve TaxID=68775 RepID=A0A5C3LYW4_9AGAR|nr:hypothetical protein BDQ12DRAFT_705992 [Crucibulum laeve]